MVCVVAPLPYSRPFIPLHLWSNLSRLATTKLSAEGKWKLENSLPFLLLPGHCVYLIRVERILIHEALRATEAHFGMIFQAIVSRWSSPDKMCATDLTSPNCRHNSAATHCSCSFRPIATHEMFFCVKERMLAVKRHLIAWIIPFFFSVISIVPWFRSLRYELLKMLRETN